MSMPQPDLHALWTLIAAAGLPPSRRFSDTTQTIALAELNGGTTLGAPLEAFRDRAVLIYAERQLAIALAAAELDGIARRLILCPPDVTPARLPALIAEAGAEIMLSDAGMRADPHGLRAATCGLPINPAAAPPPRDATTEWLLFTSGTTGHPRMVVHTLASLTGPVRDGISPSDAVWSTFYDIRRYGGLTILLRAFLGGGSMVFSDAREPVAAFLRRAGAAGVTHISGTPSHWRRALMSPAIHEMAPAYVRLSGEVADQAILNNLRLAFPAAGLAHAFASTEAGVAFDVRDGLAGFPASYIGSNESGVDMRVEDGSLRIRSPRVAGGYAGTGGTLPVDQDGFVDTGDMLELRDGRYFFVGRREGCINVGGQKVHPEEVEAVINLHPSVLMSRVQSRPNPITGALVVANIVIRPDSGENRLPFTRVRSEILSACRLALPQYKVPAMLREVTSLDINAAGKLLRTRA